MSKPRGHHRAKVPGKLRGNDWWLRVRGKKGRKKSVDPNERMVGTGITRFSRTAKTNAKQFGRGSGKYSTDLIRLEVARLHRAGKGQDEIGRILGIPRTTIENWVGQVNLPVKPTSPYTLQRMKRAVELAFKFYQTRKFVKVRECFYVACQTLDPRVKKASLDVYLSLEAIPVCPGLPLYREQSVQARCEELYFGRRVRGTDILDEVVLPCAPVLVPVAQDGPVPSGQVSAPLVRMPVVDREKFLSRRSSLGLSPLRL